MARWARILMIVGALLASAAEARPKGLTPTVGARRPAQSSPRRAMGFRRCKRLERDARPRLPALNIRR